MQKFCIKLADRIISISCNYEKTKDFCRDYLTDETVADMEVTVSLADLALEKKYGEKEYGELAQRFSNAYLEQLAVYRQIAEQMPKFDTILFHGSAIAVDGQAYLFTAPSGTGKSTHTRLWRETFGRRAFMVNDDKPLLKIQKDGSVLVYGTPWNGKHRLGTNTKVLLKGICILSQASENYIEKVEKEEGFKAIFQQTYRSRKDPLMIKKTLELLDAILEIPTWHLGCTISKEAVDIAYEAMSKEKE